MVPILVPAAAFALIVHMPAVTKVTVVPDTVQTIAEPLENVTANPELEVAEIVNGLALNGCAPGLLKVMVCVAALTVTVCASVVGTPIPLEARTVKLYVPGVVGVPVKAPAELKLRPGGRVPAVTKSKVGAGEPDAV